MNPGLVRRLLENMDATKFMSWRWCTSSLLHTSFHSSACATACSSKFYSRYYSKCNSHLFREMKLFSTSGTLNAGHEADAEICSEVGSLETLVRNEESTCTADTTENGVKESEAKVTVIAFDIETTGFRAEDDRIIEFAARDLSGGDSSTISALVNPGRYVPYVITAITGISNDMVNNPHVPNWKDIGPIIIRFVESRRQSDEPVVLVAHNGRRFDVPFLLKEFQSCSIEVPGWWLFLDSMPLARETKKKHGYNWPSLKLSDIYEAYGLRTTERAHRAMADVNMLASVLQMMVADLQLPAASFLQKTFNAEDIFASSKLFQGQEKELEDAEELANNVRAEVPWEDEKNIDFEAVDDVEVEMAMEASKMELDVEAVSDDIVSGNKRLLDSTSVDISILGFKLRQYVETKRRRPNFLHLLRVGEFYEAFFEDAETLSKICKVVLCSVDDGEIEVPFVRFPAYKVYLHTKRLLDGNQKVVKINNGDQVNVLTPGMLLHEGLHDESRNNYVASINFSDDSWGLAYCDLSTGEFHATQAGSTLELIEELSRLEPAEAVVSLEARKAIPSNYLRSSHTSSEFSSATSDNSLLPYIGSYVIDLLRASHLPDCATRALFRYIQEVQDVEFSELPFRIVSLYELKHHAYLDERTRSFLGLILPGKQGSSLFWAMDATKTPMGSRLVKRWLMRPLTCTEKINLRQSAVQILVKNVQLREGLQSLLSNVIDIESVAASLARKCYASWDDLVSLSDSLLMIPKICLVLEKLPSNQYFLDAMEHQSAVMRLSEALQENLAADSKIKTSKSLVKDEYEATLETVSAGCEAVPDQQVSSVEASATRVTRRRRGISNSRRLEISRNIIIDSLLLLQQTCQALAALDVLSSFAEIASTRDYCRPDLVTGREINIVDGRHPIAEITQEFTPNSCSLGQQEEPDAIVLTGRRGSGKTCYSQTIAFIQLLAQCGSFVPAKTARVAVADGIYAFGWTQAADILEKATCNSLVIFDDFWPQAGTEALSTAVIEYLANQLHARTILCTESCQFDLEDKHVNISTFHFSTSEADKYLLLPGVAPQSSGFEAGGPYPEWIYRRTGELMLESRRQEVKREEDLKEPRDNQNLWHKIINFTKAKPSKEPDSRIKNGANELDIMWQRVYTVLRNSPATLALAKQKGSLLSISTASEPAIVTIGSSPMFVRKFKQQEHAAALEAAFESLLKRPVRIEISDQPN